MQSRLIRNFYVILFVLFGMKSSIAEIDKNEVFEEMSYSSNFKWHNLSVKGKKKVQILTAKMSRNEIEKQVDKRAKEIEEDFLAGKYAWFGNEIDNMEKFYGTRDPKVLIKQKTVRDWLTEVIDNNKILLRNAYADQSKDRIYELDFDFLTDPGRGARMELLTDVPGGNCISVLNSNYMKQHFTDQKVLNIKKGIVGDPYLSFPHITGAPFLYQSGITPVSRVLSLKNIVDIVEEQIGDLSTIRIMYQDDPSVNKANLFLVWLIPDKGYCLHKQVQYYAGLIKTIQTFSDFREISQGRWYPFYQKYEKFTKASIKNNEDFGPIKDLTVIDDAILFNNQNIESRDVREVWVSSAEANIEIDDSFFNMDNPPGVHIIDYRETGEDGRPLSYSTDSADAAFVDINREIEKASLDIDISTEISSNPNSIQSETTATKDSISMEINSINNEADSQSSTPRIYFIISAAILLCFALLFFHQRKKRV